MKALCLTGYTTFKYADLPTPVPRPDEVLIRIKACAICGSDIHGCQGGSGRRIPPVIMGHEAAGIIEETGERVTFDSTEYCGCCDFCKKGMTNLCSNRRIVGVSCPDYKKDGAMAEFITVKANTVYPIPDTVTFEEACMIEPLSVGLHAVSLSALSKDDTVVIIGDGTIGLMTLLAAQAIGAGKIMMVGRHDYRLSVAEEISDASVINSKIEDVMSTIHNATNGMGADIIFDAVGSNQTMNDAFSIVKNGGTIVCIGNASVKTDFCLQECVTRQIKVIGSYSSAGEYPLGLRLIEEGKINLKPFINCTYPLSQGEMAFSLLMGKQSDILKIILTM